MEGDWFELEDRFAGCPHRFDVLFEPPGRGRRSQSAVGIHKDANSSGGRLAEYVGDKTAEADVVTCRVRSYADNVAGIRNVGTSVLAQ